MLLTDCVSELYGKFDNWNLDWLHWNIEMNKNKKKKNQRLDQKNINQTFFIIISFFFSSTPYSYVVVEDTIKKAQNGKHSSWKSYRSLLIRWRSVWCRSCFFYMVAGFSSNQSIHRRPDFKEMPQSVIKHVVARQTIIRQCV